MSIKPISIFYSYSHMDEGLRVQLEKHLSTLRRAGTISDWHFRKITAGDEWKDRIDKNLEKANIILLLVSSDFMASDYCYNVEMARALELHNTKKARVIPVILRAVNWKDSPFAKLQVLPRNSKPVTSWKNVDEAFLDISEGIHEACKEISSTSNKITINIPRERLEKNIVKKPKSNISVYCSRCGQEAGVVRNTCTDFFNSSHDFQEYRGDVFCSICGIKPGKKTGCVSLNGGHNFKEYSGIVYCNICGMKIGQKASCINILSPFHDFSLYSDNAYCSRCGVRPGARAECTGMYASHDFIVRGRG